MYARTNTGSGQSIDTPLSGAWLGAPHRYRIDWNPGGIVFSIDGSVVVTHPLTVSANLRPLISDLNVGGGNVTLGSIAMTTPILSADLSGTSLPPEWSSDLWSDAGLVTVAGGLLTVDGARVGPDALFSAGESLEFVGTFSGDPWQHIGFGVDYSSAPGLSSVPLAAGSSMRALATTQGTQLTSLWRVTGSVVRTISELTGVRPTHPSRSTERTSLAWRQLSRPRSGH